MEKAAPSDAELLAEWLGHQREPAFHALVARYAGLVHMAAKRTSGDETLATEASQLVFILLARKAKSLASRSSLAGWLHLTAVMQAKNLLRQNRRENHKRQRLLAHMETHAQSHSSDSWQEMQPLLDEALAALSAKDREALLLRFYRSLTIREIATTLGIATDAAQKRIDRATARPSGCAANSPAGVAKPAARFPPPCWLASRRMRRRRPFRFPSSPPRPSRQGPLVPSVYPPPSSPSSRS